MALAVATRRGRRRRTELTFVGSSIVVSSIPEFVLSVTLVVVFAVNLGLAPAAGRGGRVNPLPTLPNGRPDRMKLKNGAIYDLPNGRRGTFNATKGGFDLEGEDE